MKTIVRALRHRNFRLYFTGQIVSLTGTWIAGGHGLARLPINRFGVGAGIIGFASQIPILLFAFGWNFFDRFNRHRLILLTRRCPWVWPYCWPL
jgi:hypothetical protein